MTTTRRSKVLGTAVTAVAALGLSAALSAPAFAAGTGSAKPAVSAYSSQSLHHRTTHFEGKAFVLKAVEQFQPVFTPQDRNLRLRDGATLVNGGFRLRGGSGTLNAQGDVTENLRGTLTYTLPNQFTIRVTDFTLKATGASTSAELVGDVKVTNLAPHTKPHTITQNGLDLLDLPLFEGKSSFHGNSEDFTGVPGVVSNQAAQLAQRMIAPGMVIATTSFSIPVPQH